MTWRIAVAPGDGIGKEVIPAALDTLPADIDVTMLDLGADRYLRTGELLSRDDLAEIHQCDAVLFGAIGDPRVPDGVLERGVLLTLRRELDLYLTSAHSPTSTSSSCGRTWRGLTQASGNETMTMPSRSV